IDTADVYSAWVPGHQGGESETVIGNWLARRGRRDDVIIATKVGWEAVPDRKGLGRGYILKTVEESLRRLRTDYIDLYYSHKDDLTLGVEEPLRAHEQLLREGKVRCIGASNFSAARLRESLVVDGLPKYGVLQPHYNLLERAEFENALRPVCLQAELGVLTYFSLASGYLTGKYRSGADLAGKARMMMAGRYLAAGGPKVLAALDTVAAEAGASQAQVALAWLLAQPAVTAPIASATSTAQLAELMGSVTLRLAPEQLSLLSASGA
ncbi:MAG: hypothetical protein RLZZ200_2874, partial [Pseudomonadota bacterium]